LTILQLEKITDQAKQISGSEETGKFLQSVISDVYKSREKTLGEAMRMVEKFAYLGSIDKHWIEHIDHLDGLREGVRLRAYGQRDPIVDFKNEAFDIFETLIDKIDDELARRIFRIDISRAPRPEIPLDLATTNIDPTDKNRSD
jgi:preprotein translocase subunit SecA